MLELIYYELLSIREELRTIQGNSEPFQTKIIFNGVLKGSYVKGFETR